MGYELIDVDTLEPLPHRTARGVEVSDHYHAVEAAGDTPPATRGPQHMGFRVYDAEPGEALTDGMHYHEEQEELFYVVDGELHVETPDDLIEVTAGQVLLIEPGSPQFAFVPADASDSAHIVAAGAPSYRDLARNDGVPYTVE